jgi:hypothetical protein
MENKIIVIYVGVAGVRLEDIPDFVQKITAKISPQTFQGEIISIPVQSPDTTMECINPVYVTDVDLIKQHTDKMKQLHELLQFQIEQLTQNKNE